MKPPPYTESEQHMIDDGWEWQEPSPKLKSMINEAFANFFTAIDHLPPLERQAIRLCMNETSDSEIAEQLDVSVEEAKKVLNRGVEHMREHLQNLYSDSATTEPLIEVVQTISTEVIKHLRKHPEELYEIKPRQFEELIAEILAHYGWQVQLTKATRDGGYDLFAISKDKAGVTTSWIIECKKYRTDRKVGIDVARALYGVKTDLKVASMMLATTSFFSRDVHAYKTSRYDLELRDYEGILEWLNEYRPNPDGRLYIKDNRLVGPGEEG